MLVDLPAHGASRGRVSNLPQFARAIEYTTARLHAQDAAPRAVVAHTRAALQRRIEAREGILMRQFEPPAVGPRIALPTLVVHDRGDRINRFADGEAYRDHIPHARLLATEGLGHRKLLQQAEVLAAVADFVAG